MGSGENDDNSVGVEKEGGDVMPCPILITIGNTPPKSNPISQSSKKMNNEEQIMSFLLIDIKLY